MLGSVRRMSVDGGVREMTMPMMMILLPLP
jgi:hypothetical protein